MKGVRSLLRYRRAGLAVCLLLLTMTAPSMIVCEGAGHAAIEWIFSTCCESTSGEAFSQDTVSHGKVRVRAGTPDDRCADSCEDRSLLASPPEPSTRIVTHVHSRSAGSGITPPMLPPIEAEGSPTIASLPPHGPPVGQFSTVLLI